MPESAIADLSLPSARVDSETAELARQIEAPVCKTVACSLITPGGPQRSLAPDLPIGLPLHSLYEITDSGRSPSHGAAPSTARWEGRWHAGPQVVDPGMARLRDGTVDPAGAQVVPSRAHSDLRVHGRDDQRHLLAAGRRPDTRAPSGRSRGSVDGNLHTHPDGPIPA